MSVSVTLDGVDITADLNAQYELPTEIRAGIFPDNTHNHWWDLWKVIQAHEQLRLNYQENAIHQLVFYDSAGGVYNAKIILRPKYSARNR